MRAYLRQKSWPNLNSALTNIGVLLIEQDRIARSERLIALALDLAELIDAPEALFRDRLDYFTTLVRRGEWAKAEALWRLLDPMGRDWSRAVYRTGYAEHWYSQSMFFKRELCEDQLSLAERIAEEGKNRLTLRLLHRLRGEWRFEQGAWALAAESFQEAVRMAREVGQTEVESETSLALAKHHLGQLAEPRQEAERLAQGARVSLRALADLWLAIGDEDRAKEYALAAYVWAWADGEPYVHCYELDRSRELLERLGVEVPNLPPYDPKRDEKLPWEDEVVAAIEELRAEKAKEASEALEGKGSEA